MNELLIENLEDCYVFKIYQDSMITLPKRRKSLYGRVNVKTNEIEYSVSYDHANSVAQFKVLQEALDEYNRL